MRRMVLVATLFLIPLTLSRDQITNKAVSKQHEPDERLQITNEDIRRERFAEELAKRFSTNWRTVHFHVSGPKNTTLHMDDFLVNPSSINDLVRDGKLVEEARALGFRRLSFTDGFGNTWSRPMNDATASHYFLQVLRGPFAEIGAFAIRIFARLYVCICFSALCDQLQVIH